MKLAFQAFDLHLRHTFTISRESSDVSPIWVVTLQHEGITGYGEVSPDEFYNQTMQSVRADLEAILPWLETQDPNAYRDVLLGASERLEHNRQALCALDLALHDWAGKKLGVPLWRMLGLSADGLPPTNYTIGIDTIPKMIEKLEEFSTYPIFKIKLGQGDDIEMVRQLRASSDAIFRVDANCAWNAQETIEKSAKLKDLGVEYIEQPMAPDRIEAMDEVHAKSSLPLVADENCIIPTDIPRLQGRFHGFNIKLVKCGGIGPALEMIAMGRRLGMKIMIGCMIESSCLCTAAAHLGSLVDYLDLDGPLLIDNDPFTGMRINDGRITLPEAPGLGVRMH